jgi:hypothetical protein
MTTRLSQRKIRGGDPAYLSLKEEMAARVLGGDGTGGYVIPVGGIPRSDMTQDVQDAINLAETAYVIPSTGIPTEDLDSNVRSNLVKAGTSYQRPSTGVPIGDLEQSIQDRLTDFASFYIYPVDGIPYVDMDMNMKAILNKAESAYQKPTDGIVESDLEDVVTTALESARTAYQKPAAGIPLADLEYVVVVPDDLTVFQDHINDVSIHITDHKDLVGIGKYSHDEIDVSLDDYSGSLSSIHKELVEARDKYMSLGARIDASIGSNTVYTIDTKEEWLEGTFNNLIVTDENKVVFEYQPETLVIDLFDISINDVMLTENKVGGIMLTDKSYVNFGTKPWIDNTGTPDSTDYIGARFKGYLYAPVTGTYRIGFQFTGRSRLQIAGKLIVDSYSTYYSNSEFTYFANIDLEGGRLYPLVAEGWYYTGGGTRVFGLYWCPPGQSSDSYIPMSVLNQSGYGGVKSGTWESSVIDFRDTDISTWYTEIDATEYRVDDDITLEICTSDDGEIFSSWMPTPTNGEIATTPKRFAKLRATINKDYEEYTPVLRSLSVRYISAGNNAYIYEIMNARDTYLELKDRFESIERQIVDLSDFYERSLESGVHPEQFTSVRLSEIELNLLRYFLRESETKTDYIPLEDGLIDHFKTLNFIDMTRSENIELNGHTIRQKTNKTIFDTTSEWTDFTRDRTVALNNALQLSFKNGGAGAITSTLNNWYLWSTTTPLGQSWNHMQAQPFYTSADTGALTRIMLQVASYGNTYPQQEVLIVQTGSNGQPDLSKIIFQQSIGRPTGQINLTGLRIPVLPNTKYWLVIRMTYNYDSNGFTYWYISPNNTSTSPRLRGTNPGGETLFYWYSNDGVNWSNNGNYFLSMLIDESVGYETEGTAEYIVDYMKPTQFLNAVPTITNPTAGSVQILYQTSTDQIVWSPEQMVIADVPPQRFLKIKVKFLQGTLIGTPTLNKLEISYVGKSVDVVSKVLDLSHVPTHALFIASANQDMQYFVSRDDGQTWRDIKPSTYQDLSTIAPGMKVRLKAVFLGTMYDTALDYWGVLNLVYRDITGQNITAFHQEFVAEEEQIQFTLESPYPMGNHALEVYLNGIYQSVGIDYMERDNTTIIFTEPLRGGMDADRVIFRVATGAYDEHDMVLVNRVEDVEFFTVDMRDHDIEYIYDENDRIISEIYNDLYYHRTDNQYDAQGRKELVTEIIDTKVIETHFEFDEKNRIKKKSVTHSEVTA